MGSYGGILGCTFMRLQIRPYSDKVNGISAGSGDGLKS